MRTGLVRPLVREHFGVPRTPIGPSLVRHDGRDELEKDSAQKFFSGKSWQDLLQYLRSIVDHPTLGAAYMLEEWTVLEPAAIPYYGRAYLEHLLDTVESDTPDEEYISAFFFELYQLVYSGRYVYLSEAQSKLLQLAADCVYEGTWAPSIDRAFAPESARIFLAARGKGLGSHSEPTGDIS
jgi:hypothetical protein